MSDKSKMLKKSWYLACNTSQIADRCLLIGDPARIERIAALLHNPSWPAPQRGLQVVTGEAYGVRISAVSFGMGAPIATIVLHELFDLGVRSFLRIGTAMAFPPVTLGQFLIAEAALRREATSLAYAPVEYPAAASFDMQQALRRQLDKAAASWRSGVFATFDGFYRDLFALDETAAQQVENTRAEMCRLGILAADMETSAILTVGRILGASAGSLCLATVDAMNRKRFPADKFQKREEQLFELSLKTLAGL